MQIKRRFTNLICLITVMVGISAVAQGQQPAPQEKIAAFKQTLQKSMAQLRQYEWIETTTVMLKGEVKSQKQKRCYYGADGTVQKVLIPSQAPAQQAPGRLKGRIIAKKKEELTDYMERSVNLIHKYVPPDPQMIQYAKDNGKASYKVEAPKLQLAFNGIVQPGDLMTATLDIASNAIIDIKVSTYLDDPQDSVLLAVTFAHLPDGTSYQGQTTLDAKAKDIKVIVENTGHRPMN